MKITIFSESETDEAALKILIEGILGEEIEAISFPNHLQSRGSGVPRDVLAVLRGVYYRTEAEFLVIVRDSDDSPIHTPEHNEAESEEAKKCRLCDLRQKVESASENLRPMAGKENFRVAVGVAVPAIEAWLLCGENPSANEANWINKQKEKRYSTYNDRQALKAELYGSNIAPAKVMIKCGTKAAERLANNIEQLEQFFPEGFGNLSKEVKSWR